MDDKVEEPPEVDSVDDSQVCVHPFDVLLRDSSGHWNCMCGAVGKLEANYDGRLKFTIPKQKATRQQRRAWERKMIKEFKRSALQKLKDQPKMTT